MREGKSSSRFDGNIDHRRCSRRNSTRMATSSTRSPWVRLHDQGDPKTEHTDALSLNRSIVTNLVCRLGGHCDSDLPQPERRQ
jgi:hypothetical protein